MMRNGIEGKMNTGGMGCCQTEANVLSLSVWWRMEGILTGDVGSWGKPRAKGCCSLVEDEG